MIYLILGYAVFVAVASLMSIFGLNDKVVVLVGFSVPFHWISDFATLAAHLSIAIAIFLLYWFLGAVDVEKEG